MLLALNFPTAIYRSRLLTTSGLLLTLPLLWMPEHTDLWHAITRVAALWGGGLLLCGLGERGINDKEAHLLVRVVMLIGLLCALTVIFRVFAPSVFLLWLPVAGRLVVICNRN